MGKERTITHVFVRLVRVGRCRVIWNEVWATANRVELPGCGVSETKSELSV